MGKKSSEKCKKCGKTVYAMEKTTVNEMIFHTTCFKCEECKKTLTLSTVSVEGEKIYCEKHYKKLVKDSSFLLSPRSSVTGSPQRQSKQPTEKKEKKDEYKLLLLGTGDSGKTTFINQTNLIHDPSYFKKKEKYFKADIFRNLLSGMAIICEYVIDQKLPFKNEENEKFAKNIIDTNDEEEANILEIFTKQIHNQMISLWKEEIIQNSVLICQKKFGLYENISIYFKTLEEFSPNVYETTKEDVISSTKKTTGITTFPLDVKIDEQIYKTKIIDTGGQRNERKKWKQCYSKGDISGILFIVSLSEFDQLNYEDNKTNRMTDSLKIFNSILLDESISKIPVFLIFNKIDIFEEKIKNSSSELKELFSDYQDDFDFETSKKFIQNKYLENNQNNQITVHYSNFKDEKNVQQLLNQILQSI
eukprot:gene7179-11491_t